MPFPTNAGSAPARELPKKGKSRSRRYAVRWCYREEDSNNDDTLYTMEAKSTNIGSCVTALLKSLNDGVDRTNPDYLRKSDVVVVEARVLARGETVGEE